LKIGIYPAALYVYGGGEKYIGKIAETLSRENDVVFIVFREPNLKELETRLGINLSRVSIDAIGKARGLALFVRNKLPSVIAVSDTYTLSKCTKKYDLFINQEHDTFVSSHARRSFLICEVPPVRRFNRTTFLKRLFFDPKLKTYDQIVVNSHFTRKWAEKYYRRDATVLYPAIDTESLVPSAKENIILSVGRFCTALHCKKQLEMVRSFKKLYTEQSLQGWTYHLVGGLGDVPQDRGYLEGCIAEGKGYPIYFHVNAPLDRLKELYGKAKIFWHATGLGENENKYPERMEHFGMTTVEAMSAGCVPVVINKGGQPEIVESGLGGFLFETIKELNEHTIRLINDDALLKKMSERCMERSIEFSLGKFEARVKEIFGIRI
jgi:glycosyltransferase involved in cell wall biosynthesis